MGNAVRQGIGFARPGASDHKKWSARRGLPPPNTMLDSPPLLRIEGLKVSGGGGHGSNHPLG
jgi:hypothetical protein